MAIVKHPDRAKKLTVSLKASVNFWRFWESMWVYRKVPQSKSTSVFRKDKEVKKTIPKSGSQPPNCVSHLVLQSCQGATQSQCTDGKTEALRGEVPSKRNKTNKWQMKDW